MGMGLGIIAKKIILAHIDYTKYKREEIIESANFFDVEKFKKRLKEFIDEKMAQ